MTVLFKLGQCYRAMFETFAELSYAQRCIADLHLAVPHLPLTNVSGISGTSA
ncbi:hypothetical protein D3C78_1904480 [compost metagenome]